MRVIIDGIYASLDYSDELDKVSQLINEVIERYEHNNRIVGVQVIPCPQGLAVLLAVADHASEPQAAPK